MGGNTKLFVGRTRELALLTEALGEALDGRGSIHLLGGEPGIGKTRLARELADRAEALGAEVAWGRCWEDGGAPPYWPWVEILRGLAGSDAGGIVELIPGLSPSALADDPDPGAAQARFDLFDGVRRLLQQHSRRTPIVAILDDLHWADIPSLRLLKFIAGNARRSALLLVGTYREQDARRVPAVNRLLVECGKEGHTHPIGGLDMDAVGRLAGMEDPDRVRRLLEASGGNPFFIDELLRLQGRDLGFGPVPGGVREVLRARLMHLSEDARLFLGIASVIGRVFDLALVRATGEMSAASVLESTATLSEAGLLQPARGKGRYTFCHDLLREVVASDLPPARLAQLHVLVADALQRMTSSHPEPPWAELARHYLSALPHGDAARAIACSTAAGRQALDRLAFEDAVEYFRAALDAAQTASSSPREMLELMLLLGESQMRTGEIAAGKQTCSRAADLAKRAGAWDMLARAALAYGTEGVFGAIDAYHVDLLRQSLDAIGDREPVLRARVMARLASAMQPSAEPEKPIALARDAIALARNAGDSMGLAMVLEGARSAFRAVDSLDERLAIDRESLALLETNGHYSLARVVRRRLVFDLFELGDVREAHSHIELLAQQNAGRTHLDWRLLMLQAMADGFAGAFASAQDLTQRAMAICRSMNEAGGGLMPKMGFPVQRMMLAWAWGRPELLEPVLDEKGFGVLESSIRSVIHTLLGRVDDARLELERAASVWFSGPRSAVPHFARIAMAEVAGALNLSHNAADLYAVLLPLQGRNAVAWGLPGASFGSLDRWLGDVASLMQRWEVAESHYTAALAMNERCNAAPDAAHTRYCWARTLLRRARPEDRDRANELLAHAEAIYAQLDMPLYLERARQLRQPSIGPSSTPDAPPRLALEGEYWSVAFAGSVFRLKDSDGLRYIAHLLERPGQEVSALDLLDIRRGADKPNAEEIRDGGDAGPLLDAQAKAAYRRRLEALRDTLEEATEFNDFGRAERAQAEIDFLTAELARAVGLHGRDRKIGNASERARVNVSMRIHKAIKKIGESCPPLARYLQMRLSTGHFCVYAEKS